MKRSLAVLVLLGALSAPAFAERDFCMRDTRWRGRTVDMDFKDAEVQDVFRMISDTARINVVFAEDVKGAVTLRFRKVPWDQALCAVAATKRLQVIAEGNVYLIRPHPQLPR